MKLMVRRERPSFVPVLATMAAMAALAALVAGTFGCTAGNDKSCNVGADCVSGACLNGSCLPADSGGLDAKLDDGVDGATADSGSGDAPSDVRLDAGGCTPNKDGVITAAEVPLAAGLHATFRVAKDATFGTAGTTGSGGARIWDLSGALAGDADVLVNTLPLAGTWYAPSFPTATYATTLTSSSDLLGVFALDASALSLVGVVSPAGGATRTELKYDPVVPTLPFPLTEGKTLHTSSGVTGVTSGVPSAYNETYDLSVDAHGELLTPFGPFPVLRLKVVLTRTAGVVTITRSYAFVTECFGTVATITSNVGELSDEFTKAAEVRRLAP